MRKSSLGSGRPSLSGPPLRVRQGNLPAQNSSRSSSLERGSKIPLGRKSAVSSNQSVRPRQSNGRGVSQDSHRTSFMPQNSIFPKSGRPSSGIGVRGRTDIPRDTRPLSDKRYQNQCIQTLLEFLITNKYPLPVSQKLLSSPSNKDFCNIFEFIMGYLWDDYKLDSKSKLQEEVPHILKLLGYPYHLPKTYLCSVGSPHTWPHLLGALTWLIELYQIQSQMEGVIDRLMFEPTDEDFDGVPEDKISFIYREKCFKVYMEGQDTFEDENQELIRIFNEKYGVQDIQEILEENKRMEAMLEEREKHEEQMKELKEFREKQLLDEKSLKAYKIQLEQHRDVLDKDCAEKEEEIAILKSDLANAESRLGKMQAVYEQQDLKPDDVERVKAEQDYLHAQVSQLDKQIAEISADNWKLNMEQAQKNEMLQDEVNKYNRLAMAIKIVPESAEYADGKDYRLRAGVGSDVVNDFQNKIKPKLILMRKNLAEEMRTKKKEHFRVKCENEKLQEIINEKKEKVQEMEKELAQLEGEIETMKHASTMEQKSMAKEMEMLEQKSFKLQAEVTQARLEKEKWTAECEEKERKLSLITEENVSKITEMKNIEEVMTKKVRGRQESSKTVLEEILKQVHLMNAEEDRRLAKRFQESDKLRKKTWPSAS